MWSLVEGLKFRVRDGLGLIGSRDAYMEWGEGAWDVVIHNNYGASQHPPQLLFAGIVSIFY